jgi:hypothetical protein
MGGWWPQPYWHPAGPPNGPIQVPGFLLADVEAWARSWLSSEISENGFRVLRKAAQAGENGAISRQNRWARLLHSDVLKEHRRPTVPVTQEAREAAMGKKLSDDCFHCEYVDELCLPKEHFDSIRTDRTTTPIMNPQQFHTCGLRFQALLSRGSYQSLSKCWMSSLLQPGTVIRKVSTRTYGLVVESSEYYGLAWAMNFVHIGARICTIVPTSQSSVDPRIMLHVDKLDAAEWQVLLVEGVSPASVCRMLETEGRYELCYRLKLGQLSLQKAAALNAFDGMTVPLLELLYRELEVPPPRPSRELDLVKTLIKFIIPDISDELLAEIMSRRQGKARSKYESVLEDDDNMELAKEAIPPEDFDDVDTAAKRNKKAGPNEGPSGSSASGLGPAERLRVPSAADRPAFDDRVPLLIAQTLIPDVIGCKVTLDDSFHFRWKISYPTGIPGDSMKTAVWTHERNSVQALQLCLEWTWGHHFRLTGQKCPFRIESLPDVVFVL